MRIVCMLLIGMMAGCASQQAVEKSAPVAAAATETPAPVAASGEDAAAPAAEQETPATGAETSKKTDADADPMPKMPGYKIVNKDGKQLYCSRERVTGSLLKTRTECLTAAEMQQRRTNARDTLSDASRRATAVEPGGT